MVSMTSSRPLLDTTIYRRLLAHPKVQVVQESEVVGLISDSENQRISGVQLQSRRGLVRNKSTLAADLVVDASGRHSVAPEWLVSLGYEPPKESTIDAFSGYATRIYRRPVGFNESWKTMYIRPTPPNGTRGGLIMPIEGDRWYVTLIGMNGDYPPTDEDEFLAFARNLPTSRLYEAIKDAEPLTKPFGYRHTANRVRHYDDLPRYLEGFVVAGDAVYILNPVYAQGMTASLMGSQALESSLEEQQNQNNLTGLAQNFQTRLTQNVAGAWKMATREDRRWPSTEVTEQLDIVSPRRRQVLETLSQPLSAGTAMAAAA
jgi:2-polyprenyl-6-methoxyphenol hydroxylase-like FAD-dependent oxidoreductase